MIHLSKMVGAYVSLTSLRDYSSINAKGNIVIMRGNKAFLIIEITMSNDNPYKLIAYVDIQKLYKK